MTMVATERTMMPSNANVIWLAGHDGEIAIKPGTLRIVGDEFTAQLRTGTIIGGLVDRLQAWTREAPEPTSETGPVGLITDDQIAMLRGRLADGPNLWTDHRTLIEQQRNVLKDTALLVGGVNPSVPDRPVRDYFVDPDYAWVAYPTIDLDEEGCGFCDDGMAVFTQALWWRLFDDTALRDSAITGLMGWANTLTFFDHRTQDGSGRGKFWAAIGVQRMAWGAALLWPELTSTEREIVSDWFWVVFMDSRATTQSRGAVLGPGGVVIRPDVQGGGSLLDRRAGANQQAFYCAARLAMGVIIREVDPANGQAVIDNAIDYFEARTPCWIRENGPDEPTSPGLGYPYPPPPDGNGWDTFELQSQHWFLSLAANPTFGTNFLGGLQIDGLLADTSRDLAHAMFQLEGWCQCVVIARNNGVDLAWPRGLIAGELQAKWMNDAGDRAWDVHGGNWAALDASTWLPDLWAEHGLGTRGVTTSGGTGGQVTPSAPMFDVGAEGSIGGGWYICHWIYNGLLGQTTPELDRLVARLRGVPDALGGHDGDRGREGPAAGFTTVNGPGTTSNGCPYTWGPFLFTPYTEPIIPPPSPSSALGALMEPGKYDLKLYRGDSYHWRFTIWEDALKTEAFDLTGATVAAEFRDRPGGTSIMSLECVVTLPNTIDVLLTADLWTDDAPDGGAWDLEITEADGDVKTMIAGKVTVTPDITRVEETP